MSQLNEELFHAMTIEDPYHPKKGERTITMSDVDLDRLLDAARAQGARIAKTGSPHEVTFQTKVKP